VFERLHEDARAVVIAAAREEADGTGRGRIGCEHLLLGVLSVPGPGADALAAAGLDLPGLRALLAPAPADRADPLDAEALASIGIDLDAVRRAADATFGPGALDRTRPAGRGLSGVRFTGDAKKAMQGALLAARRFRQRRISTGHLLIGVLDQGASPALDLLTRAGVSPAALRADLIRRLAAAA
jgi:hypothetical protein